MAEYSSTKEISIKINITKYLKFLEIKTNIIGNKYNLLSNIPLNISNINSGNINYFFISATMYNKIFKKFNYKNSNKDINPFDYITINEYDKKDNIAYIKSTKQKIDTKIINDESNIEFSYTPFDSTSKYIAFILEANCALDYLVTNITVGGGYYDFYKDINISKIISNCSYYIPIKITMMQKMEIKIIIDDINIDNININPFIFANIYEKKRKDDASYIKYFNQTINYEKNEDKLIQYFYYYTGNISTNYILVELIPNINLEKILIKYEVTICDYSLNNGETQIINNDNNKNDISSFSINYIINSFFTNFIIIKIISKFNIEYLNIKMDIGGGYYDIEKGLLKNIANIYSKYSYYFFVLSSKEKN